MKATVVGLVTPHVLSIIDLAKQADAGVNIDWHLRDTVAKTVNDLGQQFNARDLLGAYIHGLETAAQAPAQAVRKAQVRVLQDAAAMATRELEERY